MGSKIVIYGKENCKWCDLAKDLAEKYHYEVEYRGIENDEHRNSLLKRFPEVRTVPQIYSRNTLIGGYEHFEKWIRERNEGGLMM